MRSEREEDEISSCAECVMSWHHDNDKQAALSEFKTVEERASKKSVGI